MKRLMLLILAGVLAFASCKKDDPIVEPTPIVNDRNFSIVTTDVSGVVFDKNSQPISDAMISFGNLTTMTDDNGYFQIKGASVKENRAFVKVSKDGYFHGSRTFFAYENQKEFVRITLLEKTIQGTVDASGGTVSTPEGVKLNFPNNAIADANGNLYTGTVQVAAQYLDPSADDIGRIMPGDLRGITTDNNENGLTTYGMVAVELLGSGGEVLNVAEGKTVELTMPVAAAQSSSAPSEIPLWFFDEAEGVWKEEGTATLQGNQYVGEVSHFTFWNCDVNWDLVYIDGSVLLEGVPYENALVCLSFDDNTSWLVNACDLTNSNGIFSGQVPTNTTFDVKIYPNDWNCGDPIYTGQIGPFTDDTTVDPINVNVSATNMVSITGNIVDCDNNAITNGYALIKFGFAEYYVSTTDGTIEFDVVDCGNNSEISITAVDLENFTQSDVNNYVVAADIDFGTIQACNTLDEFIIYEFDGVTYTLTENVSIWDSLGVGNGLQFISGSSQNQQFFTLTVEADGIGTFPASDIWGTFINTPSGGGSSVDVTFTQFSETVGETCTGTFEGTVTTQGGSALPLTGSFKAIREF